MRERIIVASGVNGNELMRTLSLHGVYSINTRIMNGVELARYALMRSGCVISEQFIDSIEEISLIGESIKDVEYFGTPSYSDVRNIASAMKRMRSLVPEQNEAEILKKTLTNGIFQEKNNALLEVYIQYMQLLREKDLIDSVMLIRRAIAGSAMIDAEFVVLDEFPLAPLDMALIRKVSDGNFEKVSIKTLYKVDDRSLKIESIKNCYGISNEVETIIADIYTNKKTDSCTVAITDPSTYGQLFFDYALIYNIPMTFGCGVPILNSNPGRLLSLYSHWMTTGFFGTDAIKKMILSDYFNRIKLFEVLAIKENDVDPRDFYKYLGEIKLTNDQKLNNERIAGYKEAMAADAKYIVPGESKEYNDFLQKQKCIPLLEIMAEELSLPIEVFISKYSVLRYDDGSVSGNLICSLDRSALSSIYEDLKVIRESGASRSDDDAIVNILKTNVMGQRSEPGSVHITSIDKAICTIRENMYIAGLSSSKYPGSPRENYLLLDSDLMLFGDNAQRFTSSGRIMQRREMLINLTTLASNLGSKLYISYSGMNVSELKRDNPSSMVFELYGKAQNENVTAKELEADIIKVDYFEPAVSDSRYVGNAYVEDKFIDKKEVMYFSPDVAWNIEKEYSPTAIETFFACPRSFMIGYILGIPEPDETDEFEVISARDRGTLAHSLMEQLADNDMSLEDFMKLSGEFFDRYIVEHPALIKEKVPAERDSFLEMMETAYKSDPHREVILKEEDIHCVHSTGVKLHGFPDRVEKLEDGSLLIVDFKTGRKVVHGEDSIYSCLQVVIYAYLMESKGYKVSGAEYRYIRLNKTVTCKYDDEMKTQLSELLSMFKEMMESGDFPCGIDCSYCKYAGLCGCSDVEDRFAPDIFEGVLDDE